MDTLKVSEGHSEGFLLRHNFTVKNVSVKIKFEMRLMNVWYVEMKQRQQNAETTVNPSDKPSINIKILRESGFNIARYQFLIFLLINTFQIKGGNRRFKWHFIVRQLIRIIKTWNK